jgi:hypothetical protein
MAAPPTRRGYLIGIVAGGAMVLVLLQLTSVFTAIERHGLGGGNNGWPGEGGGGGGMSPGGAIVPRHSGTINHGR